MVCMRAERITPQRIREHVIRLGERYPPIPMDSVDREIRDPMAVAQRYGHVIDYLARVELEVDRNVLELLVLLPDVDETNHLFYADVWQPQEIQHGLILDRLQQDLGRPGAEPYMPVSMEIKILGALAHIPAIQDVAKMLYYIVGAATERQAVLAYNTINAGMLEMGEDAIARTIITPIKRQEPGHFAFYEMSATEMVQSGALRPWQRFLVRVLRSVSFEPVGIYGSERFQRQMGAVIETLGYDEDLYRYAREIGRVEARLLWARDRGMEVPSYILKGLRESIEVYRERGFAL